MKANVLKKKIAEGVSAWAAGSPYPIPLPCEIYAAQGWDSVTIDMQHGGSNINDAVPLLQAIQSAGDATPLVRVPWNDPGQIMRALDAGAMGIICPMINTKAEAEALVRSSRYPPMGERSFGPYRASQYGADYWQKANEEILLFAMVETRTAVNNLEEILSVKGISGVYVGPSDLSLSMGKPPTLGSHRQGSADRHRHHRQDHAQVGPIAGVHTDGPATALRRFEAGFQMCTILNDVRLMAVAAPAGHQRGARQGPGRQGQDVLRRIRRCDPLPLGERGERGSASARACQFGK